MIWKLMDYMSLGQIEQKEESENNSTRMVSPAKLAANKTALPSVNVSEGKASSAIRSKYI